MRKLKHRARWWSALALATLIGAAPVVQAATLRWKLKPGDSLHYVMEQKTITTFKQKGVQVRKTSLVITMDLTRSVKNIGDDGLAEMTQKFDRVQMKFDGGVMKAAYDSNEAVDPASAPLVAPLRAMAGAEFGFKMNPQGEISDVRIPASVAKALREASANGPGAGPFSEEGFKKSMIESSVVFPKGDLAIGQAWTQQVKISSPDGTHLQTKTYTYEGPDEKAGAGVERIGLTTKVEPQRDPASSEKSDVKPPSQEGKGALYFNNVTGRMSGSDVSDKIEMTFNVMDMEINQVIDQNTTMKLVPKGAAGP